MEDQIDCSLVGVAMTVCNDFFSKRTEHVKNARRALHTTRLKPVVSTELLAIFEDSKLSLQDVSQRLSRLHPEDHVAWLDDCDDGSLNAYETAEFSTTCALCNSPQSLNHGNVFVLVARDYKMGITFDKQRLLIKNFVYNVVHCKACVTKKCARTLVETS